jgi:hypothetical protein
VVVIFQIFSLKYLENVCFDWNYYYFKLKYIFLFLRKSPKIMIITLTPGWHRGRESVNFRRKDARCSTSGRRHIGRRRRRRRRQAVLHLQVSMVSSLHGTRPISCFDNMPIANVTLVFKKIIKVFYNIMYRRVNFVISIFRCCVSFLKRCICSQMAVTILRHNRQFFFSAKSLYSSVTIF